MLTIGRPKAAEGSDPFASPASIVSHESSSKAFPYDSALRNSSFTSKASSTVPSTAPSVLANGKRSHSPSKYQSDVSTVVSKDRSPSPGRDRTSMESKVPVSQDLPTREEMDKVARMSIFDKDGKERTFGSLYESNGEKGGPRRHLIIFIRHFLCGACQEFVRTLSTQLPPSLLAVSSPATALHIIGCGSPDLISSYVSTTSCSYTIYADPSRRLYEMLGLAKTLDLGPKKPEYIKQSLFGGVVTSILQGLSTGRNVTKVGNFWQVGGEFLFEKRTTWGSGGWDGLDERKMKRGSGLRRVHSEERWDVTWCKRMRNTRDHAEISTLKQVLGLEDERSRPERKWSQGLKEVGRWRSGSRSQSRPRGVDDAERIDNATEGGEADRQRSRSRSFTLSSLKSGTKKSDVPVNTNPTPTATDATPERHLARKRSHSNSLTRDLSRVVRGRGRSRSKSGYESLGDGLEKEKVDKGKAKAVDVPDEVVPEMTDDDDITEREEGFYWTEGESSRDGALKVHTIV